MTPAFSPQQTPAQLRAIIRSGGFAAPTAGMCAGFVQANVVILPAAEADDFEAFCRLNHRPCPLIARTLPGDPEPRDAAAYADLRTDVPRYRVFRDGKLQSHEPREISRLWRDDLVGFLIGCSFTFENALTNAGLTVRHLEERRNVPMYRTNIACQSAGKFAGPMVVSMRPYHHDQIEQVRQITGRYPAMHGAPIHVGSPTEIGITDLSRPDFGDAITIHPGEIPVFWACGVTPQLALAQANCDLVITHSPGCMFVTDLREEQYCVAT